MALLFRRFGAASPPSQLALFAACLAYRGAPAFGIEESQPARSEGFMPFTYPSKEYIVGLNGTPKLI